MSLGIEAFKKLVYDKIHVRDMDLLIVCTGGRGTGKSLSMASLATAIDPTFTVEERLSFTFGEFILKIKKGLMHGYPKAAVFILDEASAEAAQARNFYSEQNKKLSSIMQVFRDMNLIVIFITPQFSFLDKQAREMIDMVIVIDNKTRSLLKTFRRGRIYEKTPNPLGFSHKYSPWRHPVWFIGGYPKKIKNMYISKPPEDVIAAYKKRKKEFQLKLIDHAYNIFSDGKYHYIDTNSPDYVPM